jgi:hypothetical protein
MQRGPDPSMMAEAGALDPTHETSREYERVVDAKYLEEIRAQAKQFPTKLLSRKSRVAKCAIRNFTNGKNTIKPRTLQKLTMAIHELQNKNTKKMGRAVVQFPQGSGLDISTHEFCWADSFWR